MTQDDAAGIVGISEPSFRRLANEGLVLFRKMSGTHGRDYNGAQVRGLAASRKKYGIREGMRLWRIKMGLGGAT